MAIPLNRMTFFVVFLMASCSTPTIPKLHYPDYAVQLDDSVRFDFLGSKYNNNYELVIDESNVSDHPQFTYLDCEKEGYFTVHFIPKNLKERRLWSKIIAENALVYQDDKYISDTIKAIIWKQPELYNIFCVHLNKEYLKRNGPCSIESTFFKDNGVEKIYTYVQHSKKWKLLNSQMPITLPQYKEDHFFVDKFPGLFNSGYPEYSESKVFQIEEISKWALDCRSNNMLILTPNSGLPESNASFQGQFSMNGVLSGKTKNEYILYYNDFAPIIPIKDSLLYFENFSTDSIVAELMMIDNSKLSFYWKGFYNTKMHKYIYTNNPFGENKNPVVIYKCKSVE